MESDETVARFQRRRERFFSRLGEIRAQVDAIIESIEANGATLHEAAMLEACQAERYKLFEEFQRAADEFTAYIIKVAQAERR